MSAACSSGHFGISECEPDLLTILRVDIHQRDATALSPQPARQAEYLRTPVRGKGHIAAASPQGNGESWFAQDKPGGQKQVEANVLGFDVQTHLFHHDFHNIAVAALYLYQLPKRTSLDEGEKGVQIQLLKQFAAPELR